MPQTDKRHIRPGQQFSFLVKLLFTPVQSLRRDPLIHNRTAFPFRKPQKRIRPAGFLIDRYQEPLIILPVFARKKFIKLLWNLIDQTHRFLSISKYEIIILHGKINKKQQAVSLAAFTMETENGWEDLIFPTTFLSMFHM